MARIRKNDEKIPQQINKRAVRPTSSFSKSYTALLKELKRRIQTARMKVTLAVNQKLIELYWDIGRLIVERQRTEGWGKSIVEKLSRDIGAEFPGLKGFSPQNIWYMRSFYLAWTEDVSKLQQPVGELITENIQSLVGAIPWGQNIILLTKLKDPILRTWYARKTIEFGWSRNVLVHQIESEFHARSGAALTNFEQTLPPVRFAQMRELFKDPYHLDFLDLAADIEERMLERKRIEDIRKLLLELGLGFAFVGSQFPLHVSDQEYFLDLLFYHTRLHCYIVVELKVESFKPEFAGKMGFYLSAVDALLAGEDDHPSISLILCKERNKIIVEYSLKQSNSPMGVAEYRLTKRLPVELKNELPSAIEIKENLKLPAIRVQGITTVIRKSKKNLK